MKSYKKTKQKHANKNKKLTNTRTDIKHFKRQLKKIDKFK